MGRQRETMSSVVVLPLPSKQTDGASVFVSPTDSALFYCGAMGGKKVL